MMDSSGDRISFTTTPGFCPDCGSILPLLGESEGSGVVCYACKRYWSAHVFGDMAMSYVLKFKDLDAYTMAKQEDEEEETEGPVIDRKCPKCPNSKMSYATMQLRSADEGQTVFYTCTKCKFKEMENS